MELNEILLLVVGIAGSLLAIAGAVAKFTKTKRDDELIEKISEAVDPILSYFEDTFEDDQDGVEEVSEESKS